MNKKAILPDKDKCLISTAICPVKKNIRQSDDQNHSLVEGRLICDTMSR